MDRIEKGTRVYFMDSSKEKIIKGKTTKTWPSIGRYPGMKDLVQIKYGFWGDEAHVHRKNVFTLWDFREMVKQREDTQEEKDIPPSMEEDQSLPVGDPDSQVYDQDGNNVTLGKT